MPCWGCLSNTTWRSKWEICCLLCASVCHQSKRGSAGCSTLLSTFSEKLTTCRSNPALKRAPVAPALFPWWRHALIFQPSFLSLCHEPTLNPTNCAPKTCWSLRPLFAAARDPLLPVESMGDNYSPSKPRGGTPGIYQGASPSLHPAHSRLEIMVGMRSFAGRLWALRAPL